MKKCTNGSCRTIESNICCFDCHKACHAECLDNNETCGYYKEVEGETNEED